LQSRRTPPRLTHLDPVATGDWSYPHSVACRQCNHSYIGFMAHGTWILLSSRLPRQPTRLRLAVWRRLKRIGAVLLHDSVWVLPADAKTREAFEWLAEEIEEQGGTALTWEAQSLSGDQDRRVIQQFRSEADERYESLAASAKAIRRVATGRRRKLQSGQLAQAIRQLRGLERALRLERRRDYFRAPGRVAAEAVLEESMRELEARLSANEGDRNALGH